MSIEQMPLDNLSEFAPAEHHPMAAPDGYAVVPAVDRVGWQLQELRVARGLTQAGVAKSLGWGRTKLVREENGQNKPSVTDARALLGVYGVSDEELIETVRRNLGTSTSGPYNDVLTTTQRRALGYEAVAERVDIYAPLLVPDILQTSDYARYQDGVFRNYSPAQSELVMRLRRERAAYFLGKSSGPPMQIIIAEGALRSPEIVSGLITLSTAEARQAANSALNPDITIQVDPYSSGSSIFSISSYARDILHMGDRPDPAVHAHPPNGKLSTLSPGLDGSTREQSALFDRLRANLPGPEHTPDILIKILASLRS
jgi:transcriptional regulator with XRE-family HTH domain